MNGRRVAVVLAVSLGAAGSALAQVPREDNAASVAGLLQDAYDEYTFQSGGGEILFVTLDADIYQVHGRMGDGGEEGGCGGDTVDSGSDAGGLGGGEPGGGGSGGGESGDGEGCGCEGETGGPGEMCLQVLKQGAIADEVLCWAGRPIRPGWQRDPRLACPLLDAAATPITYKLRVFLRTEGKGGCRSGAYVAPRAGELHPYLLNVSLRKIAPRGWLHRAIGASANRL